MMTTATRLPRRWVVVVVMAVGLKVVTRVSGQRGGEVVTVEVVVGMDVVATAARWWRREGEARGSRGVWG
ncbi:hypothetical protein Tco_1066748 [Tanacetum coccineum]|uniref:Secreted protein n=1 Tax=Tanacetum coccineum TaxID=301880 RepID=A0ABQ5HCB0_9ASTR